MHFVAKCQLERVTALSGYLKIACCSQEVRRVNLPTSSNTVDGINHQRDPRTKFELTLCFISIVIYKF